MLVLAVTGLGGPGGVVGFARALSLTLFALPAGVVADRWNWRHMIAADGVRVLAVGGLAAAIQADRLQFWVIPMVAFVEGAGAACSRRAGRSPPRRGAGAPAAGSGGRPDGPAGGGRAGRPDARRRAVRGRLAPVPGRRRLLRLLDRLAAGHAGAVPGGARAGPLSLRRGSRKGSALWSRRFLRTCAFLFGLANFVGHVLFAVAVLGQRQGLTCCRTGLLISVFGGCVLLGSFLAPLVSRVLSVRAVLLLELWTWLGCGLFLIWPNVYVLAASTLPTALAIPSTNSVVHGYRTAMAPDRLLGRVESIWRTISLLIVPLGPLVAGILLDAVPARAAIGLFAAVARAGLGRPQAALDPGGAEPGRARPPPG